MKEKAIKRSQELLRNERTIEKASAVVLVVSPLQRPCPWSFRCSEVLCFSLWPFVPLPPPALFNCPEHQMLRCARFWRLTSCNRDNRTRTILHDKGHIHLRARDVEDGRPAVTRPGLSPACKAHFTSAVCDSVCGQRSVRRAGMHCLAGQLAS